MKANILSDEEHQRRLKLYNEGLNDHQIGEMVFTSHSCIFQWRKKNGLPANKTDIGGYNVGVPMEKALTPEQCKKMKRFFAALNTYSDRYPGRVNVTKFIKAYRKIDLEKAGITN